MPRPFLSEVFDFPDRLNHILNLSLTQFEVDETDDANTVLRKCEAKYQLVPNNTENPTMTERLVRLERVLQHRGIF